MSNFNAFFEFIRFKIALFGVSLSALGFFLFNPSSNLFLILISSFSIVSATYSFNQLTDKFEDKINKGKVNEFVENGKGEVVIFLTYFIGLVSSFMLGTFYYYFFMFLIALSLFYSLFRIKKVIIVKNVYTAFMFNLLFLFGAGPSVSIQAYFYYLIISLVFFATSIIADLRDVKGDEEMNVITIPVKIGVEKTKKLIHLIFILTSYAIYLEKIIFLYPLFMSFFYSSYNLNKNRIKQAHSALLLSFIILPLILLVLKNLNLVA